MMTSFHKSSPTVWLVGSLAFCGSAVAGERHNDDNEVLSVDRMVLGSHDMQFPNDDNIHPKTSSFEVVNYILMSSPDGERWATVTLRNLSSGSRKLQSDHIMALFADGSRTAPTMVKRSFAANETISFILSFGQSKFPVLSVFTRNYMP